VNAPSAPAHRHRMFHRRTEPGAAPGSVISAPHASPPPMQAFCYGPSGCEEHAVTDLAEFAKHVGNQPVTWLNIDGVKHAPTVEQIGRMFGLHPLALEDVVHVHQRAKVEEYDGVLYIVARMVRLGDGATTDTPTDSERTEHVRLETEQVSIFLGPNFVITFQEEGDEDCLEPVRERLRKNSGRIRQSGPDYLAYAILDAVTDGYFPVLEWYSDLLDDVEDALDTRYDPQELRRIHEIRTDLLTLRRLAWPLREAFQNLQRDSHSRIAPETRIYIRDCYDHTVQILDVLETYREICADLREFYFSTLSQRTNEIVKVLTIISTIFIPLSFVAGVWGMNFDPHASPWNMPELEWRYGYPAALTLMFLIFIALMVYFWRKGWLKK
jgi:magnesium transporter